ncbi:MAG: alkaline phosphatase family protein, partial [Lachnospiraceae bacterium]|nr:alkaline phosphatase family protein [Candidatus Hippenecus merdae]
PVQHTDSVFDALIRAGKKPCIISCTPNCSMSLIWKERDMDYFIFDKVPEVLEKALEVIPEDKYDMVVVYNHNYDSRMHKTGAESEDSLAQLDDNCRTFGLLCDAVREHWKDHNTLVGFAPDHGCHDTDKDSGTHGLYMPEDINIMHFYGII